MRKIGKVMMDRLMACANDIPVHAKKIKVSNIKKSKTTSNTVPQQ
jgi:hypothetical protein